MPGPLLSGLHQERINGSVAGAAVTACHDEITEHSIRHGHDRHLSRLLHRHASTEWPMLVRGVLGCHAVGPAATASGQREGEPRTADQLKGRRPLHARRQRIPETPSGRKVNSRA